MHTISVVAMNLALNMVNRATRISRPRPKALSVGCDSLQKLVRRRVCSHTPLLQLSVSGPSRHQLEPQPVPYPKAQSELTHAPPTLTRTSTHPLTNEVQLK